MDAATRKSLEEVADECMAHGKYEDVRKRLIDALEDQWHAAWMAAAALCVTRAEALVNGGHPELLSGFAKGLAATLRAACRGKS